MRTAQPLGVAGRKKKPASVRLGQMIRVMVTKDQKRRIERHATALKMDVSQWAREVLLAALPPSPSDSE